MWHTFAAESKEELVFTNSIKEFESNNPNIDVEITMIPYDNAEHLFMVAAQGGQAPDLMRLSSDQLGAIGEVRVDGYPLLEDLRPHLTPVDRSQYEEKALEAMRYGDALYGIPASQDYLSLIFNKAIFDSQGLDYPNENWTEEDLCVNGQRLNIRRSKRTCFANKKPILVVRNPGRIWWFNI